MTRDEARREIQNRFDMPVDEKDPWWHVHNGEIYLELFDELEPVLGPDRALGILASAFGATADEYGD